jgi:copper resistance protein D
MAPNTFIWVASRAIHILAVIFWLGGSFFLALALMPVLRSEVDREARVPLVSQVGRRFSRITWVLMALLIATGLVNMWSMGFLPEQLFNTKRGAVLLIKLVLFGLILALSVVHDFRLGPRLDELATAGKVRTMEYARQRKRSSWLARLNVLLGVVVVVLILVFRRTYT